MRKSETSSHTFTQLFFILAEEIYEKNNRHLWQLEHVRKMHAAHNTHHIRDGYSTEREYDSVWWCCYWQHKCKGTADGRRDEEIERMKLQTHRLKHEVG